MGPSLLDDDRFALSGCGHDPTPTRCGACTGGGSIGRVDELNRGFVLHAVHSQDNAVPSGLDDLDLDGADEDPLSDLASEREHEVDYHEGRDVAVLGPTARGLRLRTLWSGSAGEPDEIDPRGGGGSIGRRVLALAGKRLRLALEMLGDGSAERCSMSR